MQKKTINFNNDIQFFVHFSPNTQSLIIIDIYLSIHNWAGLSCATVTTVVYFKQLVYWLIYCVPTIPAVW